MTFWSRRLCARLLFPLKILANGVRHAKDLLARYLQDQVALVVHVADHNLVIGLAITLHFDFILGQF